MTKATKVSKAAAIFLILLLCGCGVKSRAVLDDPLYPFQKNLAALHMEQAWSAGLTGKGVKIAVIDTGVAQHPDLNSKRISGRSYVGEDPDDLTDNIGHGTFIAGIQAAERGNGKGIAGMTDSDLVILKIWTDTGQVDITFLAQAIRDAVDVYECDVVNISMATFNDNAILREAVDYATEQGAILVAAAPSGEAAYPAAYENVIGVGVAGEEGAATQITAPAENLVGLTLRAGYTRDGAGSSYAAAQVSSLAALAKQKRPAITTSEFLELVRNDDYEADAARLTDALSK